MRARVQPGEVVVYRKPKTSVRPGRHAKEVWPAPHGNAYSYVVEKYWRVDAVQPDGRLVLRTRRGKRHTVEADDPNLRRIYWWERLLSWHRFPSRRRTE